MKKSLLSFFILLSSVCSVIAMEQEFEPLKLKIMSYNVRRKGKEKAAERLWSRRKEKLAALISYHSPDIIGMQEPTQQQIEDFKQSLSAYDGFGDGRGSSWFGLGTDEHNPIFYKRDLFEKVESGTFQINAIERAWFPFWTPLDRLKTGMLPRICTWAKFKHKETGKEFYFYNTHLDHQYPSAREYGASIIRQKMNNQSPIIFTGDFNTTFTDYLQKAFDNFDHARDKAEKVTGPETTRTGWDDEQLKQIDHILIEKNSGITVLNYSVIKEEKPYSSDHRPVIAELELQY